MSSPSKPDKDITYISCFYLYW